MSRSIRRLLEYSEDFGEIHFRELLDLVSSESVRRHSLVAHGSAKTAKIVSPDTGGQFF